jgi:alanine dehydrogenase
MVLVLDEALMGDLLSMRDIVPAVEACFKQEGSGQGVNSPRTRTLVPGATLNVMHGSLPYLGRAAVKCYMSTKQGSRFVLVLFDLKDGELIAVMGADLLGRYRTGATSAVATKYLYGQKSFRFAVAGSGRQALTQVLALKEVASLEAVRVWSPDREHQMRFLKRLEEQGVDALGSESLGEAFLSSDVCTTITASKQPFVGPADVRELSHINVCGSNWADRAEVAPEAVAKFSSVVVDDARQARLESGDLIAAEREGLVSWENIVELKDVVSGKVRPSSKTLFKSNGIALEDVAVASLVYDKARRSSEYARHDVDFA